MLLVLGTLQVTGLLLSLTSRLQASSSAGRCRCDPASRGARPVYGSSPARRRRYSSSSISPAA
jgi:hypothetical protein